MYSVYLYRKMEKGSEVVDRLNEDFKTQPEAAIVVFNKNKEKGIDLSHLKTGDEFYMYKRKGRS